MPERRKPPEIIDSKAKPIHLSFGPHGEKDTQLFIPTQRAIEKIISSSPTRRKRVAIVLESADVTTTTSEIITDFIDRGGTLIDANRYARFKQDASLENHSLTAFNAWKAGQTISFGKFEQNRVDFIDELLRLPQYKKRLRVVYEAKDNPDGTDWNNYKDSQQEILKYLLKQGHLPISMLKEFRTKLDLAVEYSTQRNKSLTQQIKTQVERSDVMGVVGMFGTNHSLLSRYLERDGYQSVRTFTAERADGRTLFLTPMASMRRWQELHPDQPASNDMVKHALDQELDYWRERSAGKPHPLALQTVYQRRPPNSDSRK